MFFSRMIAQFGARSLYIYMLHNFATVWISFFTVYVVIKYQTIRLTMTLILDFIIPIAAYQTVNKIKNKFLRNADMAASL